MDPPSVVRLVSNETILEHLPRELRDQIIDAVRRRRNGAANDLALAAVVELDKRGIKTDQLSVLAEAKLQSAPPRKPPKYQLIGIDELRAQPQPRWLVADMLPDRGLCVLYGEPGSGKSFLALDLAMHLALARRWADRRTRRATVIYMALEGHLLPRIEAYQVHRQLDDADLANFFVLQSKHVVDLMNAQTAKEIADQIREKLEHDGRTNDPLVIFVDTLARAMPAGNENASEDMGAVISVCGALERELGALIVLVHHSGKDASKGARGWSGLRAAADVEICVERDGNQRRACFSKVKDGIDGAVIEFRLQVVDLGPRIDVDPDASVHERRTSCVVEITRADGDQTAAPKAVGKNQRLLLNALRHTQDGRMSRQEALEFLAKAGVSRSSRYAAIDALAVAGLVKLVGLDVVLVNK